MGDAWRNQSSGQRTVRFPVDADAGFLIDTGESVAVLPVADGLFQLHILGVRNIVGNAAAFIAGETCRIGDFRQQTGIRCAVADLYRCIQFIDDVTACIQTVVDNRQTVEHGFAFADGFLDADFRFLVAVLTGVAVNGGRQQICAALVLQISQQLNVIFYQGNACTRLNQGLPFFFGFNQLLAEDFVFRQILMELHRLIKIHICAGWPLCQNFFLLAVKFIVCQFFILQFHRMLAPFS